MTMCQRCEKAFKIGGFVMLPGVAEIPHYCIDCALDAVAEWSKTENVQLKTALYIKDKPKKAE